MWTTEVDPITAKLLSEKEFEKIQELVSRIRVQILKGNLMAADGFALRLEDLLKTLE